MQNIIQDSPTLKCTFLMVVIVLSSERTASAAFPKTTLKWMIKNMHTHVNARWEGSVKTGLSSAEHKLLLLDSIAWMTAQPPRVGRERLLMTYLSETWAHRCLASIEHMPGVWLLINLAWGFCICIIGVPELPIHCSFFFNSHHRILMSDCRLSSKEQAAVCYCSGVLACILHRHTFWVERFYIIYITARARMGCVSPWIRNPCSNLFFSFFRLSSLDTNTLQHYTKHTTTIAMTNWRSLKYFLRVRFTPGHRRRPRVTLSLFSIKLELDRELQHIHTNTYAVHIVHLWLFALLQPIRTARANSIPCLLFSHTCI